MKAQLYAIVQLAIALGVFALVEPVVEEWTKDWGLWGKLTSNGAALIIGSAIATVLLGKLFNPLTLSVEWSKARVAVRGPCEQLLRPSGSWTPLGAYDLMIECQSRSLRAALTAWVCRKYGAALVISMSPGESIQLVPELIHSAASIEGSTLKFNLNKVDSGTVSWISISLEPSTTTPPKIRIACRPKIVSRVWFLRWQIGVETHLREFEITEASVV